MGFRRSMKPLLSAPLTAEELKPWQDVKTRLGYPQCNAFAHQSQDSDRRDAELMRAWARGWPIDLGGEDEEGECLFWSGARRAMRVTV